MTPEEADILYAQLRRLTLRQLFALWRLVYVVIAKKVQDEGF